MAEPFLAFVLQSGLVGHALKDLQAALRSHPAATLRQALEDDAAFHELHRSRLWPVILSSVRAYLEKLQNQPGAIQVRAQVSPPPDSEPLLRQWLQDKSPVVAARALQLPVVELLAGYVPHHLLAMTPKTLHVFEVAVGSRPPLLREAEQSQLQACARAMLHAWALGSAAINLPRPLAHPDLGRLEEALRRERAALGSPVYRRYPYLATKWLLRTDPKAPTIEWSCTERGRARTLVKLDLSRWQQTIAFQCSCGGVRCVHIKMAFDDLIAAMRDKPTQDHVRLAEAVTRPPWWHQIRRLDDFILSANTHADLSEPTKVSWQLRRSRGRWQLLPLIHRLRKKGGWTAGSRFTLQRLREQGCRDFPNADAVLAILEGIDYLPRGLDRLCRGLKLLAGFPHLHLETQPKVPLDVRNGALSFKLALAGDRLRLALCVDGQEVELFEEEENQWNDDFLDDFLGEDDDDDFEDEDADDELESASAPASTEQTSLPVAYLEESCMLVVDETKNACAVLELTAAQIALVSATRMVDGLPPEALSELAPRLALFERHVPVRLPPDLEGERIEADLRQLVRLTPRGDGFLDVELLVRPLGGGPTRKPGEPPERLSGEVDGRRAHVVRDLPAEAARARDLATALALPSPQGGELDACRWTLQGDTALDMLAALEQREDVVVEWPQQAQRLRVAGRADASSLRVAVENKRDWFGLEGSVSVGDEKIALAALLDAVRRGDRYVEIAPGRWAAIAQELRDRLTKASEVIHAGRSGLEVSYAGAEAISDLLDAAGELKLCGEWQQLVARMKAARSFEPALPGGLRAEMRPYQVEGFRWLMRMAHWGAGACLADDMGLGKTLQALAVLLARKDRGPALVVAPTSVGFNWLRECERFCPDLRPIVFREGDRAATLQALKPGDLLISSYGLLVLHAAELQAVRFGTVVLDEAQAIKNPATQRARAARDLDAEWRMGLTGTPMENHLGELWSLLRVLAPGLLGSWEQFRERFAGPIERLKDPSRREALARVVRPFILRRTKAEVAPDLPPRTELRRTVALSAAERNLYEEARLAALAQLTGAVETPGEDRRFAALAALTRLRQLACHPRLQDPGSKVPSSKLRALLELVEELQEEGHRALVFSQFTSHLALVRDALEAHKVTYLYLDGQTPENERARRVDAFQNGEAEVFLISLKAGGTGLNLTGADYVIHLDPWWNPAVEDQASDRAHRIGQTRPVTVYRLVASGTIEEAILALHEEKRDLVAGVLGGSGAAAKLSTEELLSLIRGGENAPDAVVEDEEPEETNPAKSEEAKEAIAGEAPSRPPSNGTEAPEEWLRQFGQHLLHKSGLAPSSGKVYLNALARFVSVSKQKLGARCTREKLVEVAEAFLAAQPASSPGTKMFRSAVSQLKQCFRE